MWTLLGGYCSDCHLAMSLCFQSSTNPFRAGNACLSVPFSHSELVNRWQELLQEIRTKQCSRLIAGFVFSEVCLSLLLFLKAGDI